MRMTIVFYMFVFTVMTHASSCEDVESRSVDDTTSQSVIRLTKVYNDSIVVRFKGTCSDWKDGVQYCRFISEDGMSTVDSTIFARSGHESYYDLFERIHDGKGDLVYTNVLSRGYRYLEHKFSHGRLAYVEYGCSTKQPHFKDECKFEAREKNAKKDSNENYVFLKEKYFWDNYGRLMQSVYWDSDNVFEQNGTYTYRYGSPCDSIRVGFSDETNTLIEPVPKGDFSLDLNRFDGTFGMMPDVGDPEYKNFTKDPYEFEATPELLERQKKRCEDYKKSLKKK